jgi:hypothetical protein
VRPETRQGGNRGNQYTGGKKCQNGNLPFCQTAANLTGESTTKVQRLVRIAKLVTRETEECTVWADNHRALMKLCKLAPDMQQDVALKAASGESDEIYDAIARVHRDRFKTRRCSLPLEGRHYRILHGDFREVGYEVASGSIDLLLSDPPYEKAI